MNNKLKTTSPIVTVFGGSGFIGRYVVSSLVKSGYRVRVAVRNPNDALFLKTLGQVGQVELLRCDILNYKSVSSTMKNATFVINCVAGNLYETNYNKMKQIYVDGSKNIAKNAIDHNIKKFIHFSSLGSDINSESMYFRYKAEAEKNLIKIFKKIIILKPSIVFGAEDKFFNNFASMSVISPIIPLINSKAMFQPIYVGDIAKCVMFFLKNDHYGSFELGGPEKVSFKNLIVKMLKIVKRKKIIIDLPFPIAKILAFQFYIIDKISFGFFSPKITLDNIRQLQKDNVIESLSNDQLVYDFEFVSIESVLPSYLYQYRPYGQYSDLKDSANDLKN